MFCPRCGQQPASQSIRFCANCGLRLEGVSHLLTNDGLLPHQITPPPPELTLKKREMRRGAKLFFASFISFPLFALLCAIPNNPVPLVVPLTLFIAGISWMLYAKFFCDDTPLSQPTVALQSTAQPTYFPPPQSHAPIPSAVRTAEIEPPHSVIEHTTRQLVREKQR
ncbi:MAG TPA: zinc ribbon domain-containing protein [Blastocatellia bacterium]|nr:zinc ribbon domain-containing protein [Blastocatellia bacterium]